jgi:hypothetical protein
MAEIVGIEPAARRKSGFPETLHAFLAQRDLKDSEAVEGDANTGSLGETLNVCWVTVARGDREIVGWACCSLDRGRQHSSRCRGSLAWPPLADKSHRHASHGEFGGNCKPDQATADDNDVGGQRSNPVDSAS